MEVHYFGCDKGMQLVLESVVLYIFHVRSSLQIKLSFTSISFQTERHACYCLLCIAWHRQILQTTRIQMVAVLFSIKGDALRVLVHAQSLWHQHNNDPASQQAFHFTSHAYCSLTSSNLRHQIKHGLFYLVAGHYWCTIKK